MSMTSLRPWKSMKRNAFFDGGKRGLKMTQLPFMAVLCTAMLFIFYRTTVQQHQHTQMEEKWHPFDMLKESALVPGFLGNLPHGVIHATSDLELKPLWSSSSLRSKIVSHSHHNLLAISVGMKQKHNVDSIVQKRILQLFCSIMMATLMDGGILNGATRSYIVAQNQTKWWFAKRFLHAAVVSIYDYIFLWDEDLGVKDFNPRRYLEIVRSEGLEISQPALGPNSTDIHHRITIRSRRKKVHRRVYDRRGKTRCSDASEGPPSTGFVEGMAPVFSRSAWYCTWHLIQNGLVHGWGMDMKLGYCAQGDRTRKVGVIDSEYIVHQGIQTLGGAALPGRESSHYEVLAKGHGAAAVDPRIEIRRQSTWEFQIFKERWHQAVKQDKHWVDPFRSSQRPKKKRRHYH